MCILHVKDTPRFISNETSNPCVHFSFNYFALNSGSLIFFYNKSSKLAICQAPVNTFALTIICAMHKDTKLIFFHNLSHVIKQIRVPGVICPGTVGPSRPGFIFNHCFQAGANKTTVP